MATFSHAVLVTFPTEQTVDTTERALELLMDASWPNQGPRHRDATETCLKVIDGHRSTIDAETTFVEAAREAGILVD